MVHSSERTTAVVWVDALGAISRVKDVNAPFGHLSLEQQSPVAMRRALHVHLQHQHKHIYCYIE